MRSIVGFSSAKAATAAIFSLIISGVAFAAPGSGPFAPPAKGMKAKLVRLVTQESATFPLQIQQPVYSVAMTGEAQFNDSASLVRVILTDKGGNDHLLFDGYPLLTGKSNGKLFITAHCEETCALPGVVPASLRVVIENAGLKIHSLSLSFNQNALARAVKAKGVAAYARQLRARQSGSKLAKIQSSIARAKLGWIAGKTSVSEKSYAEKERLFGGDVPNLQGFDYYTAGYFNLIESDSDALGSAKLLAARGGGSGGGATATPPPIPTSDLVPYATPSTATTALPAWDWRNAHGENWMTAVKDQGWCGSCWDFSSVGAIEAAANLYFNQHVNLDLSEQQVLSCVYAAGCGGGNPGTALSYATRGLVEESCMPYKAIDASGCNYDTCGYAPVSCSSACSNPLRKAAIAGAVSISGENNIKTAVMNSGALVGIVNSWSHGMTIAGYGAVKEGDRIFDGTSNSTGSRIVAAGDSLIGKTYWLFKNSWGAGWGEAGYAKLIFSGGLGYPGAMEIRYPVTIQGASVTPACVDKDGDGYCNWGVGPRPLTCSPLCAAEKDCDDSNPAAGVCGNVTVTTDYMHTCREYLAGTAYCPNTTQSCPSGYKPIASKSVCATSKRGPVKTQYWTHCARDFSTCGVCPAGSVLAGNTSCATGQMCSTATNTCTAR